jgi:serine kinase of HPr protein (carbohydrate metabolism regulator)
MRLRDIVDPLRLSVRSGKELLDREVSGGYVGDLLSDVIANGEAGSLWITMQVHSNIVAVAVLKELAGIIIVQGREPAEETLVRATEEKIPVLVSQGTAFEMAGQLYTLLSKSP